MVQTRCPWGNPLRSSPECLDMLLDDSKACLARCPLPRLPLGTPGTVLFAHSRSPIGLLWVWLGLSFGSWKGKKLEFSDTLALREVSGAQGGKNMCPLLRSCQDTWHFRNFCTFLTNCIEGGCSKRKPDINSPFKQGKALERLAGLCCAVEEILQRWQSLAQGRLLRKCLLNKRITQLLQPL